MEIVKQNPEYIFGKETDAQSMPPFFFELTQHGNITFSNVQCTPDRFFAVTKSISNILIDHGIPSLRSSQGRELPCDRFFDDWYLYAVPENTEYVYGLFKMREQEYDAENGILADGDTPGVTISFVSFDTETLVNCLSDPTPFNQKSLEQELNRVVASRGQRHHPVIKEYFKHAEAQGPYMIAALYVRKIAFLAQGGCIPVPKHYAALCLKLGNTKYPHRDRRLPAFIAFNNEEAGYSVCDGEKIFIRDPNNLSVHEEHAILATHTANVSFNSFAAEVCFHAKFLTSLSRIPIPFLGHSIYDSAIRADMTIDEGELVGPTPYYRLGSRLLRRQQKFHQNI